MNATVLRGDLLPPTIADYQREADAHREKEFFAIADVWRGNRRSASSNWHRKMAQRYESIIRRKLWALRQPASVDRSGIGA
jgi:hypothetical protein